MNKVTYIHIKFLRGNFFLLISNDSRELVFNKSCGNLGFKNIQKRSKEAFRMLLSAAIQYLLNSDLQSKLLIKIEGCKKEFLTEVNNQFIAVLKSCNVNIFAVKLINKISHNGCRKSYFRK